ncbi:MAG: hypothetical protein ABW007_19200 [Chitinophagaceae bacterium]
MSKKEQERRTRQDAKRLYEHIVRELTRGKPIPRFLKLPIIPVLSATDQRNAIARLMLLITLKLDSPNVCVSRLKNRTLQQQYIKACLRYFQSLYTLSRNQDCIEAYDDAAIHSNEVQLAKFHKMIFDPVSYFVGDFNEKNFATVAKS